MNILILGSGGREHALAWAIRQNPKCDRLFVAPGNPGMEPLARLAALDILSGPAVIGFCEENAIDLVVIGPAEVPLKACLQFKGRIAQTPVKAGKTNTIQLTISNIFEDWQKGLNMRNTDESHRRLHPDDRFFRYQNEMADRSIYWGSKKDAPGFIYKD